MAPIITNVRSREAQVREIVDERAGMMRGLLDETDLRQRLQARKAEINQRSGRGRRLSAQPARPSSEAARISEIDAIVDALMEEKCRAQAAQEKMNAHKKNRE